MAVNYIHFKCETEGDLKREGTDERSLRSKPQKCSVITLKSIRLFCQIQKTHMYSINPFSCIFTQNFAIINITSCNNTALC